MHSFLLILHFIFNNFFQNNLLNWHLLFKRVILMCNFNFYADNNVRVILILLKMFELNSLKENYHFIIPCAMHYLHKFTVGNFNGKTSFTPPALEV